jgi:hypothetical protein
MVIPDEIPERSTAEWVAMAASDAEQARRAVAPYAGMTPAERLRALASLNGWLDAVLGDRLPSRVDGEPPFWMVWKGLARGRAG